MPTATRKTRIAKRYLLKEVNKFGVRLRDLALLTAIPAKPGVTYTLLDAESLLPVDGVIGKKKKTSLEIFVDDEKVGEITDFFGAAPVILTDSSAAPLSPLAFFDPVNRLSIDLDSTAEGGSMLSGLGLGGMTLPALGLGGLLLSGTNGSSVSAATTAAVSPGGGASTLLGLLKGTVMAGPVLAGTIIVKAFDSKGGELGSAAVGANGTWEISDARLFGYIGTVLVRAFDANGNAANYRDEVSGANKSLSGDLRAFAVLDGTANSTINITPVSELAVRASGLTGNNAPAEEAILRAIGLIKSALNLSFDPIATAPVATNSSEFNADGDAILSDGEKYGILLAKLSGADSVNNGDMEVTLTSLDTKISQSSSTQDYSGVEQILESGRVAALDALKSAPASDERTFLVDTPVSRYLLGEVAINSQSVDSSGALVVSGSALPNTLVSLNLPSGETVSVTTDANGAFVARSLSAQPVGTIKAESEDILGAPVSKDVTLDTEAPVIIELTPENSGTDVALDSSITIKFSEAVARGTGTIYLRKGSAAGAIVEAFDIETSSRLNFIGDILTITPTTAMLPSTSYFVTGKNGSSLSGITDSSGNDLNYQDQVYSFTTVAGPDVEPVASTGKITLSASKTTISANEALGIIFKLSSLSNDFTVGDIAVSGGTIEQFERLTDTVYTAVFKPASGAVAAFIAVDSHRFRGSDGAWNMDGTDADNSLVLSIESAPSPGTGGEAGGAEITVSTTAAKTMLAAGEAVGVIFVLSAPSDDFTVGDISVSGGMIEQFVKLTESVYSAVFTPAPGVSAGFISVDSFRFRGSNGQWNLDGSELDNSLIFSVEQDAPVVSDTTPPVALQFSPTSGATQVPVDTNIYLGFSESIKRGLGLVQIRQTSASGPVIESFDLATSGRITISGSSLVIDPTAMLAEGVRYYVSVSPGAVTDLSGNLFGGTTSYEFTTANTVIDTTPPLVVSFSPADGSVGVPLSGSITLTFNEAIARGEGLIQIRENTATGNVVESFDASSSEKLSFTGQTLIISPSTAFMAGKHYYVTVAPGAVTDSYGNDYAGTVTYDFMTSQTTDTVAPVVLSFNPGDGSTVTDLGVNISLTFSEPVAMGSGVIKIHQGSANGPVVDSFDVTTSVRLTLSANTLFIDPTILLAAGEQYFVSVPQGAIQDLAGNSYAGSATYDFKVESKPKIVKISSDMADRLLVEGDGIAIDVDFDQMVNVSPTGVGPVLALSSGGLAYYQSGSGSSRLTFSYVVGDNDESMRLNVGAFALNDSLVATAGGIPINESIDFIRDGNLEDNNAFVVDANPPDIIGITNSGNVDSGGVASGIITVYFDQPILVSGYASGSGDAFLGLTGLTAVESDEIVPPATLDMSFVDRPSNVLYFRYSGIPSFGDVSEIDVQAFVSNGRVVSDSAGNLANLIVTDENNIAGTDAEDVFTLLPAAGPFDGGFLSMRVYDAEGSLLLERRAATGELRFSKYDFSSPVGGWLLIELHDDSGSTTEYLDEFTGIKKSLSADDNGFSLRTFAHINSYGEVVVSPLTELATRFALSAGGGALGEDAQEVADAVSLMFGVDSILSTPVVFSNTASFDLTDGVNAQEEYGRALALLSAADSLTGSMSATLDFLSRYLSYSSEARALVSEEPEKLTALLTQAADMAGYDGWSIAGLPSRELSIEQRFSPESVIDACSITEKLVLPDVGDTCWDLVDSSGSVTLMGELPSEESDPLVSFSDTGVSVVPPLDPPYLADILYFQYQQ